jgi:hypothetical protein
VAPGGAPESSPAGCDRAAGRSRPKGFDDKGIAVVTLKRQKK